MMTQLQGLPCFRSGKACTVIPKCKDKLCVCSLTRQRRWPTESMNPLQAEVGWRKPAKIRNVRWSESGSEGREIAAIESIRTSKPLWDIARGREFELTIDKPTVLGATDEDGDPCILKVVQVSPSLHPRPSCEGMTSSWSPAPSFFSLSTCCTTHPDRACNSPARQAATTHTCRVSCLRHKAASRLSLLVPILLHFAFDAGQAAVLSWAGHQLKRSGEGRHGRKDRAGLLSRGEGAELSLLCVRRPGA